MTLVRRVWGEVWHAVSALTLRVLGPLDDWARYPRPVRRNWFGDGATQPFEWYLSGTCTVPVASITDVCNFLLGCEYTPDSELFHVADYWQHPAEFEHSRRGDCDCFALWAWRRLCELRVSPELVTGMWMRADRSPARHLWVVIRGLTPPVLLEATNPDIESMVQPLEAVRSAYVPFVGLDCNLQTVAYAGVLRHREFRAARPRKA